MSKSPIHIQPKSRMTNMWETVARAFLSDGSRILVRRRSVVARRLRMELLESRQVMASDLSSHLPMSLDLDVNCDAKISAEELSLASAMLSGGLHGKAATSPHNQSDGGGVNTAARGGPAPKPAYQYWVTGNSNPKDVSPTPGLALIGGGSDVEEAFRWLGEKADGGDFLVLTASSNGIYNNYISRLSKNSPLDSVETLQIPSLAAANDLFVKAKIDEADAIFITGGDQSKYANFWDETLVEDAIYAALARGVPIGGTSAGLAVLGDFDFSAVVDTISSAEALENPYHQAITLDGTADPLPDGSIDGGFLSNREFSGTPLAILSDTITDSHFEQRDRMGRLLTFMARLDADGDTVGNVTRGIGINEQTALLIEADGMSRVVGNPGLKSVDDSLEQRSVYFLSSEATISSQPDDPLTYGDVAVARAKTGDWFNLYSWDGGGGTYFTYTVSAIDGELTATDGVFSLNPYGYRTQLS